MSTSCKTYPTWPHSFAHGCWMRSESNNKEESVNKQTNLTLEISYLFLSSLVIFYDVSLTFWLLEKVKLIVYTVERNTQSGKSRQRRSDEFLLIETLFKNVPLKKGRCWFGEKRRTNEGNEGFFFQLKAAFIAISLPPSLEREREKTVSRSFNNQRQPTEEKVLPEYNRERERALAYFLHFVLITRSKSHIQWTPDKSTPVKSTLRLSRHF